MASTSRSRAEAEAPDAVWAVEVLPGPGSHDALSLAMSDAKKLKERHVSIKLVHVTCAVSCGLGGELPVSRVDKRVVRAHEVSVFQTLVHPLVKLAERRQVAVKYVPVCNDIREKGLVQAVERIGAARVYIPVQKNAMRKFEGLCLLMPGGCCLVAVQDGKRILEHDVAVVSLVGCLDGTDIMSTGLERQPSLRSTSTEDTYVFPSSPNPHSGPSSVCLSPLVEPVHAKSSSAGHPPLSPKSLLAGKQHSKSLKGEQMSSAASGAVHLSPQLPLRRTQTTKYMVSGSSSFQERQSGPLRQAPGDPGEPCGMPGGRVQSQPHLNSAGNLALQDSAGSPRGGTGGLVHVDDFSDGSRAAFPTASTGPQRGPRLPVPPTKSFSSESLPLTREWDDDVPSEVGQKEDAADGGQQMQLQQQMLMHQQMMLMQQQMQQQQYQQRQHMMFAKLQHQQQMKREPEVSELVDIEGLEVDVLPQDSFQREMVLLQQHWQEYSEEQSDLHAQHPAQHKLEQQQRLKMSMLEQQVQLLELQHLEHHQHHEAPSIHHASNAALEKEMKLGSEIWEGKDKTKAATHLVQLPQDSEDGAGEDMGRELDASARKYRSRNLACVHEGVWSRSDPQAPKPTPTPLQMVRRSESDTSSRRHGKSPSWGNPEAAETVPKAPALPAGPRASDVVTTIPAGGRAGPKRMQSRPKLQGSVQDDVDMGERQCSREAVVVSTSEKKVAQRWFSMGAVRTKAT